MPSTPWVANEPWAALGQIGSTFSDLDRNTAARAESMQKDVDARRDFAKALITSAAAHNAFGGMQIGALAGSVGNLPEGALSGAYTGRMDATRAAKAAGGGRGGGGSGASSKLFKGGMFYQTKDGQYVYGDEDMAYALDADPVMQPPPGSSVFIPEKGVTVPYSNSGAEYDAGSVTDPGADPNADPEVASPSTSSNGFDFELDAAQASNPDIRIIRDPSGVLMYKPRGQQGGDWQPYEG